VVVLAGFGAGRASARAMFPLDRCRCVPEKVREVASVGSWGLQLQWQQQQQLAVTKHWVVTGCHN
jgi:hypothetical protein